MGDFALSLKLAADLAVHSFLVGLDRQHDGGALLDEELKNSRSVCGASG